MSHGGLSQGWLRGKYFTVKSGPSTLWGIAFNRVSSITTTLETKKQKINLQDNIETKTKDNVFEEDLLLNIPILIYQLSIDHMLLIS